jgi:hypothetical protein
VDGLAALGDDGRVGSDERLAPDQGTGDGSSRRCRGGFPQAPGLRSGDERSGRWWSQF